MLNLSRFFSSTAKGSLIAGAIEASIFRFFPDFYSSNSGAIPIDLGTKIAAMSVLLLDYLPYYINGTIPPRDIARAGNYAGIIAHTALKIILNSYGIKGESQIFAATAILAVSAGALSQLLKPQENTNLQPIARPNRP